jgi:ribonuclease BN (tRNA processing enzyme)
VLVDAGTVGSALFLPEQQRIRQILLSHLHFDHVKGLPTLGDNLVGITAPPVLLRSIPEVLDGLRRYVFNEELYPDFFKLPTPDHPVFSTRPLAIGRPNDVGGLAVTPVPVNHLVPTIGFLIRDGNSSVLYSGDTYQTEELWKAAANEQTLKAAFIETSFPDDLSDLARASKHLTPALLAEEFRKIGRPDLPLYIYHMKPRFRRKIQQQLMDLKIANLHILEEGDVVQL